MKERPILFIGPMVRAILDGRKTQTRRIVKGSFVIDEHPETGKQWPLYPSYVNDGDNEGEPLSCPFGAPGDRLWVRETWFCDLKNHPPDDYPTIHYAADMAEHHTDGRTVSPPYSTSAHPGPWRPSIHMPRWASRITLEVTDVRVERVQDISEEDAQAEGVPTEIPQHLCIDKRAEFREVWDVINEDRAPWDSNPWVWVVEFRRVEA